ncbi:MAG: oligosaccharide flippase family protein [Methanomassiliicoccales archaeon]|nr:MAG: oligosaccharide flippase family protein [Methanomassiliicoccales archaeon]
MLGRKSLLVFLGSTISSALGFICLFFITNYVGVDKYGTVILMTSILTTINVIADLGFSSAHIKRISEGQDVDDCVSTFVLIKINLTCLFVIASFLALFIWMAALGRTITDVSRDVFLVMLLFEVFVNLSNIAVITFQGRSEVAKVQFLQILNPLVRLPLVVLIAFAGSSAVLLAVTYMLGAMAMMIASFLMIKRARFRWKRPTLFRSYLTFTVPIIVVTIVSTLYLNIDKIIIGLAIDNVHVGYYSTVQTFLGVIAAIGTAVSVLTFPNFSYLFGQGRVSEVREKALAAERYISMVSLPLVIVLVMFPSEVLSTLFGPDLAEGGDALRFLAIGTYIVMINQPYSSQLLAANRPDILAKSTIIGFAIGTGLFLLLIPKELYGISTMGMGLAGAGIAIIMSNLGQTLIVRSAAKGLSGLALNMRMSLQFLTAIFIGILSHVVFFLMDIEPFLSIRLFFVVLGIPVLFYTLLIIFNEVSKEDIKYFKELINIKKMVQYIINEARNK